jgi:hypothetical protein
MMGVSIKQKVQSWLLSLLGIKKVQPFAHALGAHAAQTITLKINEPKWHRAAATQLSNT